ncbi:hypothetical protein FRC11_014774, partial [Ceratobasidium sp. 423]
MPPKLATRPCLECFNRSHINPSGRSHCNGGNLCKWCKNNKAVCSYEYQAQDSCSTPEVSCTTAASVAIAPKLPIPEPVTRPSTDKNPSGSSLAQPQMFVIQHDDGSVKVGFRPDLENIGMVNPDDLGEGDMDPYVLPAENYNILVNAVKWKHVEQSSAHNDLATRAKCLRGGADHALALNPDGPDPGEGGANPPPPLPPPPPPLPPQAQDPAAQIPVENAGLLQALITSSNTATLALMQVLRCDNDNR